MIEVDDVEAKLLYKLAARHAGHKVDWCNGWPDIWNSEEGVYEQWRPLVCDDQAEDLRRKLRIEIIANQISVSGIRRKNNGEIIAAMFLDVPPPPPRENVDCIKRFIIVNLSAAINKPEEAKS